MLEFNVKFQHTRSVFQMNSFLSLLRYPLYFILLDMLFCKDGIFLFVYELTSYIYTIFRVTDIISMDNIDLIRKLVIVSLNLHTNKITIKQNHH